MKTVRRLTRWLVHIAAVTAALVVPIGLDVAPAAAHASLVGSHPADGAALEAAPGELQLRFSEAVRPAPEALRIIDHEGRRVASGTVERGDAETEWRADLPSLPDGLYTVTWRALSGDDHPVRGSFVFRVGRAAGTATATANVTVDAQHVWVARLTAASRWLMYIGVLVAAGGVVFISVVHDGQDREARTLDRIIAGAAATGVLATLVGVPLQAVLTADAVRAAADPDVLAHVLTSNFGIAARVRLLALVTLLAGIILGTGRAGRRLALAGGLLALVPFAISGHAATAEPRLLAASSTYAHTLTGAVWFGGLVMLASVLRSRRVLDDPVGGATLVARFSTLAIVSVVVVVAAGSAMAWTEVTTLHALLTTPYGRTLLTKVVLVAAVVVVGGYNNRRLVPAIRSKQHAAWQALQRTVRLEVLGIAVVLVATTVLVSLTPARVAAGIDDAFSATAHLDHGLQVSLVVAAPEPGTSEIDLRLEDDRGRPVDLGRGVALRLELPDAGVAALERHPQRVGINHYRHVGPELSVPGRWRVEVIVEVSRFERRTVAFDVPVAAAHPSR